MKDPRPIQLMTTAEVIAQGWGAEARDADGHLMSCYAPFDKGDDQTAGEWVRECQQDGYTVTVFPRRAALEAGR